MANYAETELSYETGRPIEIYDIAYSGNSWHYTNDVEELMLNNALYVPIPINVGKPKKMAMLKKPIWKSKYRATQQWQMCLRLRHQVNL